MNKVASIFLIASMFALNTSCNERKATDRADTNKVIGASEVPQPVTNAFNAKYSGAAEVIWEDAHEGKEETFKVKFKKDGKYWKVEFKPDGSLVKEKEDN